MLRNIGVSGRILLSAIKVEVYYETVLLEYRVVIPLWFVRTSSALCDRRFIISEKSCTSDTLLLMS